MKALQIGAIVVALTGASAWDAALPFTLLAFGLTALTAAHFVSEFVVRRRRVTRLRHRLVPAPVAEAAPVAATLGFAAMEETLIQLAASLSPPALAAETETLPSAEIFILDHYRKGEKPVPEEAPAPAVATPVPEAVVMQRRLAERVGGLRERQELLPRYVASRAVKDAT